MEEILIKPVQIRRTAQDLRGSANKIRSAIDNVDAVIRDLSPSRFEGYRANELRAYHRRLHDKLNFAHLLVIRMAQKLEELAKSFEETDRGLAGGFRKSILDRIREIIHRILPLHPSTQWTFPPIKDFFDFNQTQENPPNADPAPEWLTTEDNTEIPSEPSSDSSGPPVVEVADDEYTIRPGEVEHSQDAIDKLDVEHNYRYHRNRQGKNETYCNIFAMDYAHKMGAPLPEFLDWNNDKKVDRWMDANKMVQWLRGTFPEGGGSVVQGPAQGWRTIDAASAAELSSKGYVVLAGYENTHGIGHMAVEIGRAHV